MDLNLVILTGRLAAPPELRVFDSGTRLLRLLVTIRSDEPTRRVDVVPVTFWNPDDELATAPLMAGSGIWVAGSVQRRFWGGEDGRLSRMEVVAHQVVPREVWSNAEIPV